MANQTINGIYFDNIPNKKAGVETDDKLTQVGVSGTTAEYMLSDDFYPLVNAVDIDWNGAVLKIA